VSFFLLVVAWSFSIKDFKDIKQRAGEATVDGNSEALSVKPFGAQLRTLEFAAILVFTTIQVPRSNIYMERRPGEQAHRRAEWPDEIP